MLQNFEGKTALLTGASGAIALAIAGDIVTRGGAVCLVDHPSTELEQAVVKLGAASATAVAGSPQDPGHRLRAVERTVALFGSVDLLINITRSSVERGRLIDADVQRLKHALHLDIVTPLAWIQTVCQYWMRERGGVILNVVSGVGSDSLQSAGEYAVMKDALVDLTQELSDSLAPAVRVNSVAFGIAPTTLLETVYSEIEDTISVTGPTERLWRPQEIANEIRFLLESGSDDVTGRTLILEHSVSLRGRG